MKVNGNRYRTIWISPDDPTSIEIIDQSKLPHTFEVVSLKTVNDFVSAIKEMLVRGAGLIGATAGYGMYVAALTAPPESFSDYMYSAAEALVSTRPTAKNLEWAVKRQLEVISAVTGTDRKIKTALDTANAIADEDADYCRRIGEHGAALIRDIAQRKKSAKKPGGPVNILTHCNAGWLAFVDYGSATAPIYTAFNEGINVHVWVDETRPRNQGARLTAWELGEHGVPHHLIVDNAGGHLMQHGLVDIVIVGSDRTTVTGDVANKIGTYLKALAAHDNGIPFYVALPSSTFDWELHDGVNEIPIEERDSDEVRFISGRNGAGRTEKILLCPETTEAKNYGFDVTPGRLVSGLITERGICRADKKSILKLYPEKRAQSVFPPSSI